VITYPPSLQLTGGAQTGLAPCNLLDVLTVEGNLYYWADRAINAPAIITADGNPANQNYLPWLVSVGSWKFHRSMQTDTGSFVIQNVSGDSLQRDFEKIVTASAMEGAFFVYRHWDAGAAAAWIEVHGTLSVQEITDTEAQLKASQLLDSSQADTPLECYGENCQLLWGSKRCGSTQEVECQYSFQTCQVVERFMGVINSYEKNYGETLANVALTTINRRRQI
jgi:hypothetical protein